jgi:hypothetical protein
VWNNLGRLIPQRLEQLRLRRGSEAQQVLSKWTEIAPRHLGAGHQTKATTLVDGVLTVEVADGIWGQEIGLRARDLMRDLNEGFTEVRVKRIRTRMKR